MIVITLTLRKTCGLPLRGLKATSAPKSLIAPSLTRSSSAGSPQSRLASPIQTARSLFAHRTVPDQSRLVTRGPRQPPFRAARFTPMSPTTNSSGTTPLGASADIAPGAVSPTAAAAAAAVAAMEPESGSGPGPSEQPSGMEAEAVLLAAFSEVPIVSRVAVRQAGAGGVVLTATLQQRNLAANAQRRFTVTAALQAGAVQAGEGPVPALVGLPQELSGDAQIVSVSPSGSQQLVVLKGPSDTTSVLLQVWRGARMVLELAVPKALHGPLVNDGYFASGAAWAADESAVVYTAETPPPERPPPWQSQAPLAWESAPQASGANGSTAAAPRTWRGVGAAEEDWGELNTGKRPPAPYVLDLVRREVLKVPSIPAEHSVGQPAWCPPQPAAAVTVKPETNVSASTVATGATVTTVTETQGTMVATTGGGPNGLVFVAWPHRPPPSFPRLAASTSSRKLGVVFCYNRSAHLYHIAVQRGADGSLQFGSEAVRLCHYLESALSPTFSPGGKALVFVSHEEAVRTGTHGGTARLYRLDWSPENGSPAALEPCLVVDVVQRPEGPYGFPGLYTANVPDDGFVGPTTLLLNTQWGGVTAVAAVDIFAGTATAAVQPRPLTPLNTAVGLTGERPGPLSGSWALVGVAGGLMVANRAAPNCPSQLYVAELPADRASLISPDGPELRWRPVGLGAPVGDATHADLPPVVQEALENLSYTTLKVTPRMGDVVEPFDCLVWYPRDTPGEQAARNPRPAIICPHGGPHTAINLGWYPPYAYLAALGYVVLCPNYRGSAGYGQAALSSLPGAIGRQDVDDCLASVEAAVERGLVDPARVSVVGGSHGGFLTGHLLGQHGGAFRAGVMRNPVTNIAAMVAASDIPDWCFVEVFGSEEGRRRCSPVPSPDDLAAMYDSSPIKHVDNVTSPLFVMLGSKDRRVPPLDGLQYITALRGRDVGSAGETPPSRMIVFPEDTHGLDKPQTEYEQWLNAAWWIKTYGGMDGKQQ